MYKLSAITRTVGVGAKHAAVSRTTQQVPFPPHRLAHRSSSILLLYLFFIPSKLETNNTSSQLHPFPL